MLKTIQIHFTMDDFNRKPWFLPFNVGFSCKFSPKTIHWLYQSAISKGPLLTHPVAPHGRTSSSTKAGQAVSVARPLPPRRQEEAAGFRMRTRRFWRKTLGVELNGLNQYIAAVFNGQKWMIWGYLHVWKPLYSLIRLELAHFPFNKGVHQWLAGATRSDPAESERPRTTNVGECRRNYWLKWLQVTKIFRLLNYSSSMLAVWDISRGRSLEKSGTFQVKKFPVRCFSLWQWIGLRGNLQENLIFNGKIYGFL